MIDFMQQMTPGDWLMLFFTVLGAFGSAAGFIWWMAAMFNEQKHVRKDLASLGKTLTETAYSFNKGQGEHRDRLEDHEGRIIRLETPEGIQQPPRHRPRRGD